jgi:hypothetical protein
VLQSVVNEGIASRKVGEYVRIVNIIERHMEVLKSFDDVGSFREFPVDGGNNMGDVAISQDLWSTESREAVSTWMRSAWLRL